MEHVHTHMNNQYNLFQKRGKISTTHTQVTKHFTMYMEKVGLMCNL